MVRKKFFVLSILIFVLYALFILHYYGISIKRLNSNFLESQLINQLKTTHELIKCSSSQLDSLTKDYANWTDTYSFIENQNQSYLKDNFSKQSLNNLNIVALALYSNSYELLYYTTSTQASQLPVDQITYLISNHMNRTSPPSSLSIVSLEGSLYFFSIQPISNSDYTAKSNGFLCFIRPFETDISQRLKNANIKGFSFIPKDKIPETENNHIKSLPIDGLESPLIIDTSISHFSIYYPLLDFQHQTVSYLNLRGDASFLKQSQDVIVFAGIITVFIGILFALGLYYFLRYSYFKPMEKLRFSLNHFKTESNHEFGDALDENLIRKDEIGELSRNFLDMKNSVFNAYAYIEHVNQSMEQRLSNEFNNFKAQNTNLFLSDTFIEKSSEGIVIYDATNSIIRVNDAFCAMSGYSRDELIGKKPDFFKSDYHSEAFYSNMWEKIFQTNNWTGEIWDKKKDGSIYPKWMSINVIKDENGDIEYFTSISSDISKIKESEEQLKSLAFFDSLTQLPNRSLFNDRLSQSLKNAERYKNKFALFYMDLDGFKKVNDNYGHAVGNELLIAVANRLSSHVRKSDTVSRLGGDEFTIILHPIAWEFDVEIIAKKIIDIISSPFIINHQEIYINISIGIALIPDDGLEPELLVQKADAAMYVSKSKGPGHFTLASSLE